MKGIDKHIQIQVIKRANLEVHDKFQWNHPIDNFINQAERDHTADAAIMSIKSRPKK